MEMDRTDAVRTLLERTEAAHGTYESTELNGVYDQEWPAWYAAWAVEHGIAEPIGHAVTTDQLGRFLAETNVEFEQAEPTPSESWQAYTARRIAAEL